MPISSDAGALGLAINGTWMKCLSRSTRSGTTSREILPSVAHRQHRYLNNRAENSHQPTCQRERRMQRFKSSGHAQHFRPRRHRWAAPEYRQEMKQRCQIWGAIMGTMLAA